MWLCVVVLLIGCVVFSLRVLVSLVVRLVVCRCGWPFAFLCVCAHVWQCLGRYLCLGHSVAPNLERRCMQSRDACSDTLLSDVASAVGVSVPRCAFPLTVAASSRVVENWVPLRGNADPNLTLSLGVGFQRGDVTDSCARHHTETFSFCVNALARNVSACVHAVLASSHRAAAAASLSVQVDDTLQRGSRYARGYAHGKPLTGGATRVRASTKPWPNGRKPNQKNKKQKIMPGWFARLMNGVRFWSQNIDRRNPPGRVRANHFRGSFSSRKRGSKNYINLC